MVNRGKTELQKVYESIKNTLRIQFEEADFEALELVRMVCGASRQDLMLGKDVPVSAEQRERLKELVRRRMGHEPLQYLLGEWDFFGRTFAVGPGVLIPRADTEPLAEACLELLKGTEHPRVLDLCAGTGCIGITLALERPDAEVWAVEKSPEAYRYFQRNNEAYGGCVQGILGDALEPEIVSGSFDLIVSNPPYLTRAEMEDLQPEVAREPAMALYGREDGLFFYRECSKMYPSRLKSGGMLAFEIGQGEEDAVCGFLAESGMISICQKRDLHGIIRVITARNKLSVREDAAEV